MITSAGKGGSYRKPGADAVAGLAAWAVAATMLGRSHGGKWRLPPGRSALVVRLAVAAAQFCRLLSPLLMGGVGGTPFALAFDTRGLETGVHGARTTLERAMGLEPTALCLGSIPPPALCRQYRRA